MFQVLENQNDQELIFYKSIFVIFIAIHNMFDLRSHSMGQGIIFLY